MDYKVLNKIRDHTEIRHSFNELAMKTFSLSFEDWHNRGYWTDKYIPYVLLAENKVVSNVSVNIMDCCFQGQNKRLIQLGTVMTDENYRNQGLSKFLMKTILEEWVEKSDGIYLYANDSVIDFYPKFGFEKANEFQYCMNIVNAKETGIKLNMDDKSDVEILCKHIKSLNIHSLLTPIDYEGLMMFYCSQFMKDSIYYLKQYDAVIVADFNQDEMLCYEVFGGNQTDLNEILSAVSRQQTKKVRFGFTPRENKSMTYEVLKEEDTTFFWYSAKEFIFRDKRMMFPLLSHA